MADGHFKDLTRRTAPDTVLREKGFNITKNPKYDRCQRRHASMVYKFFDKNTSGGAATLSNKSAVKNGNMSNNKLAKVLHKQIISKVGKKYTNFL